MKLIIVESPTKAKTLSRFLGSDFTAMASMGHVRDLPKKKLGVDLENNYKPEFVASEGKSKIISELKKASKKAKQIIIATDPDREGEAIAYHVAYIIKDSKKPILRITFHEITKEAINKALEKTGSVDMKLVYAQQGRRVLDRLVGYKLSPLLWRKVRRGLSAGRVQSVTVRLIVDREREIQAFKPANYWEFSAKLYAKKKSDSFTARLLKVKKKPAEIKTQAQAKKIAGDLKKAKYQVASIKHEEVRRSPPPPFITSTLQRTASNMFHFSAKKTMSVAQRLYEAGLITYHRTDSVKLSNQAISILRKFVKSEYGEKYLFPSVRVYKTKSKSAQEAHEAIRPTKLNFKRKLSPEENKLFDLIKKRSLATQMAVTVYERLIVDILADTTYLLRKTCQDLKFQGYLKVWGDKKGEEDPEADTVAKLKENDSLNLKELIEEKKQTQPPGRYTEAGLIKALEDRGIGRPSTYAPIISTIQNRQYVEKQDGSFCPTPVGMAVTDYLEKYFPKVMDYDFTALMEDNLDKIADGQIKWQQVVDDFYKPFSKTLEDVGEHSKRVAIPTEKIGKKCPKCKKGEQVIRIGRFGRFLSCSTFPDCDWKDVYKEVVEGVKCPDCEGKILVRQTRRGKRFYGCEKYPKCKWASWRKPQSPGKKSG